MYLDTRPLSGSEAPVAFVLAFHIDTQKEGRLFRFAYKSRNNLFQALSWGELASYADFLLARHALLPHERTEVAAPFSRRSWGRNA